MTAPTDCTECERTRGGVLLTLAAVRNALDQYVEDVERDVLAGEARVHNRMRELKVAVRARMAHMQDHVAAAHRSATS